MANKEVEVQGFGIRYKKKQTGGYICLTDMAKAKNPKHTGLVIAHWLRTVSTLQYLGLWESLNNPGFNVTEFGNIRSQAGENSFVLTAQDWIERTGAIGLISSTGRYGGAYVHKDIAFKFASWISVEFELYLIKEFQLLKVACGRFG